jgi:hypothetical protein
MSRIRQIEVIIQQVTDTKNFPKFQLRHPEFPVYKVHKKLGQSVWDTEYPSEFLA